MRGGEGKRYEGDDAGRRPAPWWRQSMNLHGARGLITARVPPWWVVVGACPNLCGRENFSELEIFRQPSRGCG